ncbi:MAG TPA: OB-fold nucleic acid binding domain-containing protein [Candidatus Limnocylindrales bacterium]|nr:OB-fold nucleic acid binding domain-containing protein [Candidatus Limnocylindrales bacterium]
MRISMRLWAFLSLALLGFTGCPALGPLDSPGGIGGVNDDVIGEVQFVDNRTREVEIRSDSGRRSVLRFDNNTQVIYRQRSYPVSNLERGDYVAARVQQDRDGRWLTTSISVRETAQDRGMGASIGNRLDRTEGRVENIDTHRGTFEIRDPRNRIVVISIAFNAPRTVADRFNRLRNGDYVRIEGRLVNSDRFDLENFL